MRTVAAIDISSEWASLLAQLREAHGKLGEAMAEFDRMTREPAPERDRFARARWNISHASLRRRVLWGGICASLTGESDVRAADVRRLQDIDIGLVQATRAHVELWTTDSALAEWDEYCSASRDIRWKMAAAMESERRLLYPLLERLAQRSQGNDAAQEHRLVRN